MKKICIVLLSLIFLTTGCFADNKENLVKDFEKYVNNSKSYHIEGDMEITNGEETFTYDLNSYFMKDDYYKVVLVNKTNNHEQVILRDSSSVYVITPSLNKSFKFDSIWPENSSQGYLLSSLLKDVLSDDDAKTTKTNDGYEIKSAVNYPNNSDLSYQVITFNKDKVPTSVKVYDKNDVVYITVNFSKINIDAKLREEDFKLENYIDVNEESKDESKEDIQNNDNNQEDSSDEKKDDNVCGECEADNEDCKNECTEKSGSFDNILYPLYVPSNTSLTNSESVMTDYSERVVLTFGGDSNFVIMEELSNRSEDFEIIPISGNPVILDDTLGAISTKYMYFTKNGVDYYIVSNDLSSSEMVSIANSVGSAQSVISTK